MDGFRGRGAREREGDRARQEEGARASETHLGQRRVDIGWRPVGGVLQPFLAVGASFCLGVLTFHSLVEAVSDALLVTGSLPGQPRL